jgi:sphinganine-1-phosphate aldolase
MTSKQKLILLTLVAALVLLCKKSAIRKLTKRKFKGFLLSLGRRWIPSVRARVEAEKRKIQQEFKKTISDVTVGEVYTTMAAEGMKAEDLEQEIRDRAEKEKLKWDTNTLSGSIYSQASEELTTITSLVAAKFNKSNLLHAEQFPAARQCEAEVIAMTLELFRSPTTACGSVTSGGTESLLLAVKTYRDIARKQRGISCPNMIVSRTAHAAFWKAAEYFDVEIVEAEIIEATTEIDVKSVESLINRNTILIVGSAPSYPYGTIDPIEHLAVLATAHDIFLHVDSCLGGFLMPFVANTWRSSQRRFSDAQIYDESAEQTDICYRPPPRSPSVVLTSKAADFTSGFWPTGVSSISVDPHKYGYTPKGCSVLMWRTKELRHFQYSYVTDWSGGVYATPTICGSRPGFPAVAAWATFRYYGTKKYKALADEIVTVTQFLAKELPCAVPELKLIGRADVSVVAFAVSSANQTKLNIFDVSDEMKKIRSWQLNVLQNPPAVHIAVTSANAETVKKYFIADLRRAVNVSLGKAVIGTSDTAAFYGASAQAPVDLLDEFAAFFLDASYDLGVYLILCFYVQAPLNRACLSLANSSETQERLKT